jgi:orotate phosphoribosyltransferase
MRSDDFFRGILVKRQVLLEGHFLLASGRHSRQYFEKFRILQYPDDAAEFCRAISGHFSGRGVTAVAGPTTGGIIIAYQTAQLMGVRAIYAERTPEGRGFLRGMALAPEDKVLVVDDVLTTGGSARETVEAVRRSGAELAGVAVFIDRSHPSPDFGAPFLAVFREAVVTYAPDDCPLCRQGLPLIKPGSSPSKK